MHRVPSRPATRLPASRSKSRSVGIRGRAGDVPTRISRETGHNASLAPLRAATPDWEAAYAGRRVAVLGASGFIGRWVARELCVRKADVVAIVRNRPAAEPVLAEYGITSELVEFDAHEAAVSGLLRHLQPSITFNLIGYGVDPRERDEHEA